MREDCPDLPKSESGHLLYWNNIKKIRLSARNVCMLFQKGV